MKYSILSSSISPADIQTEEAVKALGASLIQEGELKRAMGINSFSEEILCTEGHLSISNLVRILFGACIPDFFAHAYVNIHFTTEGEICEYYLTLYAFMATLPQEDMDELISFYSNK